MVQVVFASESAESRSSPLIAERLINMLTERQPEGAKTPVPLFTVPGLKPVVVWGAGPVRGIWAVQDILYGVSGTGFYRLNNDGTSTLLGTGIGGTDPVCIADNGTQICIVNGTNGWIWTAADGLQLITSPNFFPTNSVIFFDGYFVFNRRFTAEYFLSALYDGMTYSGTDFATTESSSESISAVIENLQLLFFFKGDRIELWYDAGTADFPFARYAGGVINRGCVASASVMKQDGAIFFLGDDAIVYRLQGNVPVRISTHAIENLISKEPAIQNVSGFTFTSQGHKFVCFTLPVSEVTIIFDIATGKWHERQSYDMSGTSLGVWRVWQSYDGHFGNNFLGDAFTGQVWEAKWDTVTEGAFPLKTSVISNNLQTDRKRIFVSRFELDVETGVGNDTDPDPPVELSVSKDGGRTFNVIGDRSMGADGDYGIRLRWLRLGQARQWVFKLTTDAAVTRTFIGAYCDFKVGM